MEESHRIKYVSVWIKNSAESVTGFLPLLSLVNADQTEVEVMNSIMGRGENYHT